MAQFEVPGSTLDLGDSRQWGTGGVEQGWECGFGEELRVAGYRFQGKCGG